MYEFAERLWASDDEVRMIEKRLSEAGVLDRRTPASRSGYIPVLPRDWTPPGRSKSNARRHRSANIAVREPSTQEPR